MTRRARRIIFYVLVGVFIVLGAGVVLYADGWRINFLNFHTEKVGGIYVRAYPQNASISLDGKQIPNQSNFLSHGTLISDLYPKTYKLSLSLPGYDAWQENAAVNPSLVVEMKYAVLVPQVGIAIATTSDIANFFVVGNDHVDQHANGNITWRGLVIGKGAIISHSVGLKNLIYQAPGGADELYDFTTEKTVNLGAILQKQRIASTSIETIVIDPYNDTSAYVSSNNKILAVDLAGQTASIIATSSLGQAFGSIIAPSQQFLAWSIFNPATDSSTIIIYDKFFSATSQMVSLSGATRGLTWVNGNTLGILQNDGSLSLYNPSTASLRPLASAVKSFYPNQDGSFIAALEADSLEIFDFANNNYFRFNLPDMGAVQELAWHKDQSHLFVAYRDHVSFFDLADIGLINVTTISEGTKPFYDPQANIFYIIKSGNILAFTFPS